MAKNERVVNMKTYKRKHSWNIGLFVFCVVFFYLLVTIITYVTKDRTAVYEVREGSILKDTSYSGILLREEELVTAEADGYINFFTQSGQKLAVGSKVYTLSPAKLETEKAEEGTVELTAKELDDLEQKIKGFNKTFRNEEFRTTDSFKEEVSEILQSRTTQNRAFQLNTLLENKTEAGMEVYTASNDGIIQYTTDGLEGLQLEAITLDLINKVGYTKKEIVNNSRISAGSPAYRLVTDENWKIVFPLDPEMETVLRKKMGEQDWTNIKVRILKDNETMVGVFQLYKKNEDEVYGYVSFTSAMIRYAGERYLDIELILEDETGLKIPKSAVTEKDFYVIPADYLTVGGSSKESGVLRQTKGKGGQTVTEFLPVTIVYQDSETEKVYLNTSELKEGDSIIMPESTQTLTLKDKGVLQGVYNVNKGYAVFKQVNILCESEEYYIVEEGNSYGLSNYDRIALDGAQIKEGQLVNQ